MEPTGTLPKDVFCAVVRATLPCRVCGLPMPVNHLPIDDKFRCLHCGRAQVADEDSVEALIEAAHGVADLAGEPGPYENVGVSEPTRRVEVHEGEVIVGRGQPRCVLCEGALSVTLAPARRGVVAARCLACGDEAEHSVELRQTWRGMVGAIAPEHRVDRTPTKLSTEGPVVALSCPKCGGPLDPKMDRQIVSCGFCATKSLIVEETWALLKGPAEPVCWYLLFRGPSKLRGKVERDLAEQRRRDEVLQAKRREGERRHREHQARKAAARQRSRPRRWFEKYYTGVAVFTMVVGGVACAVAVGVGWDHFGEEGPAVLIGLGVGASAMFGSGRFFGEGKTDDMTPRAAIRVIQFMAVCVVVSLCALLVLLTLAPSR